MSSSAIGVAAVLRAARVYNPSSLTLLTFQGGACRANVASAAVLGLAILAPFSFFSITHASGRLGKNTPR